jgi:hypothetical protein
MRGVALLRLALILLLPAVDLAWNLLHLNIGLVDFYGLAVFARNFALHSVWPATPYYPAGYPLLLVPCGLAGSALTGGYVLSAVGLALTLWSAGKLSRLWGLSRVEESIVIGLCWVAPVWRVVAGSPSVDALYTGLGAWFIVSALTILNQRGGEGNSQFWATAGLVAAPAACLLLRYHALVLAAPVLVVMLLLGRRRARLLAAAALGVLLVAHGFNYLSYYAAFREQLRPAALVQVATGLELEDHARYATADGLWNDYAAFAGRVRNSSLLDVATVSRLFAHTGGNWIKFLRQPAVTLALALTALALALRRRMPPGLLLLALWIACYTLALSPAYYTARAAVLPAALGVCAAFAAGRSLLQRQWLWPPALAGITGLLCLGYMAASQFARQDLSERRALASVSHWVDASVAAAGLTRDRVASADWRVLPLAQNPWAGPYLTVSGSWLDDPAVKPAQRAGVWQVPPGELAAGAGATEGLVLREDESASWVGAIRRNNLWELAASRSGYQFYVRTGTRYVVP